MNYSVTNDAQWTGTLLTVTSVTSRHSTQSWKTLCDVRIWRTRNHCHGELFVMHCQGWMCTMHKMHCHWELCKMYNAFNVLPWSTLCDPPSLHCHGYFSVSSPMKVSVLYGALSLFGLDNSVWCIWRTFVGSVIQRSVWWTLMENSF